MRHIVFLFLLLFFLPVPILRAQEAPPSLITAIQAQIKVPGENERPQFSHALTDLNGDGQADAIVLLEGPDWCGSGGCTMLVFKGRRDGFTFISRSTVTSRPIRVSPETNLGWKTLIVYTKGAGDVLMRFSGGKYPLNPSLQRKATPAQMKAAEIVL